MNTTVYLNEQQFILASSSPYRKTLLQRLGIAFTSVSPDIDESQLANESENELVERLSIEKARVVASTQPNAWVIGSDQVATFEQKILGKPGNFQNAFEQLASFSGKQVKFITGVCLYHLQKEICSYRFSETIVYFKNLSENTIEQYLKRDTPYDCAGSFKVESLGVSLFEQVISDDPTALEGLPLISLCQLFASSGIDILQS